MASKELCWEEEKKKLLKVLESARAKKKPPEMNRKIEEKATLRKLCSSRWRPRRSNNTAGQSAMESLKGEE